MDENSIVKDCWGKDILARLLWRAIWLQIDDTNTLTLLNPLNLAFRKVFSTLFHICERTYVHISLNHRFPQKNTVKTLCVYQHCIGKIKYPCTEIICSHKKHMELFKRTGSLFKKYQYLKQGAEQGVYYEAKRIKKDRKLGLAYLSTTYIWKKK